MIHPSLCVCVCVWVGGWVGVWVGGCGCVGGWGCVGGCGYVHVCLHAWGHELLVPFITIMLSRQTKGVP